MHFCLLNDNRLQGKDATIALLKEIIGRLLFIKVVPVNISSKLQIFNSLMTALGPRQIFNEGFRKKLPEKLDKLP